MQENVSKPLQKWKLWSGLAVLFLSGVLIGALSMGIYTDHFVEHSLHQGPSGMRRIVVKRLSRELKLNDDQKKSLDKIVCRTQAELYRLRQVHRPEFEEVVGRAVSEMRKDLTPDQQQKLDAIHERLKQRWDSHGKWSGKGKHGAAPCE